MKTLFYALLIFVNFGHYLLFYLGVPIGLSLATVLLTYIVVVIIYQWNKHLWDKPSTPTNENPHKTNNLSDSTNTKKEEPKPALRVKKKRQKEALILHVPGRSQIDLVITVSRTLEQLLEQKLSAQGRGLHEKLGSIEGKLPKHLVKSMRWIASVRNNTVHGSAKLINKADYIRAANNAIREIDILHPTFINE